MIDFHCIGGDAQPDHQVLQQRNYLDDLQSDSARCAHGVWRRRLHSLGQMSQVSNMMNRN